MKKKLPRAAVKLLGVVADEQIARDFDVPVSVVFAERCERVGGASGRVEWNPSQVALLGTASDADVAAELGLTTNAVFGQRVRRGIKAFGPSTEERRHRWTKRQLAWLGKLTDAEVARRLGISTAAVAARRRLEGIHPIGGVRRPRREWTAAELRLLGRFSDREVAERTGTHRHQVALQRRLRGIPAYAKRVHDQRWTEERLAKLNTVSSRELAAEIGVSTATVEAKRASLRRRKGGAKSRGTEGTRRANWTASQVHRLGTVPDSVIAEELGITRAAVHLVRKRLGIEAWAKQKKKQQQQKKK